MESSNRKVVIALATALGLSLLVIAFLLGRVSAKPTTVAPAAATTALPSALGAPTVYEALSAPPQATPLTVNAVTPASSAATFTETLRESAPMPTIGGTGATAASLPAERQNVAAYFAQLDQIEEVGGGDPQAFASSMMQSLSSGDFSKFDDLLAKARKQKQRLQSMAPPSVCVEHHRQALALSGDSVTMLERLKAALMKGDSMALMGIASEGQTLETQANQLKALGEKIKRQAGV